MAGDASRWRSFEEMADLIRSLNVIFRKTFGERAFGTGYQPGEWVPSVDLYTHDGHWVVRVELPGVRSEDVSIAVLNNQLYIRGERKPPEGFDPEKCIFQESSFDRFERAVVFPGPIREEEVRARFDKGVLFVTLPATEGNGRRIEVQSEKPPEEKEEAA
ncbi:Hsp20/alpha crystallin family protein [Candidatus Manganitrophus noduliformans]|uniref:Hsp20/alpha crystallin family protein n=1 Tax=Candidatus Manganitrophus noduliformans TaxID=2606439 RepID=A0A7X6DSG4_9BACT|nr:Hsp20/alpha crystallin family protein [Candidatus Manganitrophus noduliformans]NKE72553.1 Hsp20/alpha crystallin family protein [Candidatus Manganitrophus noduliformans]